MSFDINKVLDIAKAEVGYLEKKTNSKLYDKTANAGYGNYTKYAYEIDTKYPTFYNGAKNGYDWCDIFVDWCFITAYGEVNAKKLLCQPSKSCGAGCYYSANYYKQKNQLYTSPKVGDQIFFQDSDGDPCHTGIVYAVDNTYVYTIEGNTSSAVGVVANGGCVAKKKYSKSSSYIHSYGRPNYGTQTTTSTTTKPTTQTTTTTTTTKPSTSTFKSYKVKVTADIGLNVRKSASTSSAIVTALPKGTTVTISKESKGWGYVADKKGWICLDYTSKVSTTATTTTSSSTSKFKAYKVKVTATAGLNIRKKATTLSSKVGALTYGTVVTISKVSGKWGYITNKGWICLDYTSKV